MPFYPSHISYLSTPVCFSLAGRYWFFRPMPWSSPPSSTQDIFFDYFPCFPGGSDSKESACNAGDLGSISGSGRSPGKGKGYPLQYTGLENSMDYTVHGLAKSQARLSNFHFHMLSFHCVDYVLWWTKVFVCCLICLFWLSLPVPLISHLRNYCQIHCHEAFPLCFLLGVS